MITPPTTTTSLDEEQTDWDNQKLIVFQLIGRGLTSDVMKCLCGSREYAMKIFKDNVAYEQRIQEVSILHMLRHPNIVQYVRQDSSSSLDWFMTELLIKEDLFDFLKIQKMSQDHARYIFTQLLSAVQYIHLHGISHRDLKLENILLAYDSFEPKICDFGFAVFSSKIKQVSPIGTPGYMAPELYYFNDVDYMQADVFSLGVILFLLIFSHPPFESTDPTKQCCFWKIIRLQRWDLYWNKIQKEATFQISNELKQLLQGMLEPNPQTRITLKEIKVTNWIQCAELYNHLDYLREMERRYDVLQK